MSINFFLYRRLSQWITCEFSLGDKAKLSLKSKYEVASFKDVFCHPFYWQIFQWVKQPPKLVIDCGAHCGHFSVLADICFNNKFGKSDTFYILVEPNHFLIPTIQKNIRDAGIEQRVDLRQGLLGAKSGEGTLWVDHKNYLTTGVTLNESSQPLKTQYINLSEVIGDRAIDLMKLDIEGGEFEFIRFNLDLLKRTKLIFMELHAAPKDDHEELFDNLRSVGLNLASSPLEVNGQQLLILEHE